MRKELDAAQAHASDCDAKCRRAQESEATQRRVAEQWQAQYLALVGEQREQSSTLLKERQSHIESSLKKQAELDKARAREVELQAALAAAKHDVDQTHYQLSAAEQEHKQQVLRMNHETRELEQSLKAQITSLKLNNRTLREQAEHAQSRAAADFERAAAAMSSAARLTAELQTTQDALNIAEDKLRRRDAQLKGAEMAGAELQSSMAEVEQLRAHAGAAEEAAQLRTELLRLTELCDRQEVRVEQAERSLAEALDKVAEREELKAQVTSLREAINSAQEVTGERDIKKVLFDYQQRELKAAEQIGKLLEDNAKLQSAEAALQQQCTTLTTQLRDVNDELRVAQAKALDLSCSIDVYKAQVLDLQQLAGVRQMELQVKPAGSNTPSPSPEAYAATLAHASELQNCLKASQDQVEALRAASAAQLEEAVRTRAAERAAQGQLSEATTAIAKLERRVQSLMEQAAQLQLRLGAGEINKAQSRILHLKLNPASSSRSDFLQKELETVKAENDVLRARMLELECVAGSSAGTGTADSGAAPGSVARLARMQAELRIAQQTVVDLKQRSEKMTTHFVDASRKYRDAVSKVLGWSMKMIVKPGQPDLVHYKLARRGDPTGTKYILLSSQDGNMELDTDLEWLNEPAVSKLVAFYYHNENQRSIPTLLANLLMHA